MESRANFRGKTIWIYLADGTASGIRHAELVNWSGQALFIPRNLLSQARGWEELERPGVYFLFGPDGEARTSVYIGEAESVITRLFQHLKLRDDWEVVIAFTSKDEHLTKSHVRYLESMLIREASLAGRYAVQNSNQTELPKLPRGDRDAMDEYRDNLRVIIAALGHPVLEPVVIRVDASGPVAPALSQTDQPPTERLYFSMTTSTVSARGYQTPDGFVVEEGAKGSSANTSRNYGSLKANLIEQGVLTKVDGECLCLTKTYKFNSPSAAASILSGRDLNGRVYWKLADGRTLKEWENDSVDETRTSDGKEL